MEETGQVAQLASEQSIVISVLWNILKGIVALALVIIGRLLWNLHTRILENKEAIAKINTVNPDEYLKFKEKIKDDMAEIKSDLRSNTEKDAHIDEKLADMKSSIDSFAEKLDHLSGLVVEFISKKSK